VCPNRRGARHEAAHDLVAREHILEGARQYMVHTGLSVGSRRALIEDILRRALTLLYGLLEDLGLLPKLQDVLFHRSDIEFRRYGFEHFRLLISKSLFVALKQNTHPKQGRALLAVPPRFPASRQGTQWTTDIILFL
jgi:hypothetical protein